MIEPNNTLADVALRYPSASRIFRQHKLDFCCGGKRSVADACSARGIDADAILQAIETSETKPHVDWQTQPVPGLIQHIHVNFHDAHRRELPDLIALARKVERVHADKESVPAGLADHLVNMQQALELHMQKEEVVLFPAIARGQGEFLIAPVRQMEHEHEEHAENLQRMRELAANFVPPPEACTSWRALFLRCEQLEADVMAHVHLENHVLFPRALQGEL